MAANGLDNPDFLQIGQQLVIPVGGLAAVPTEPPTATALNDAVPTPIATLALPEGQASISIGEVIGAGILAEEAVTIVNSGSRPQALLGWSLSDQEGHVYTFGQVTLFGDGSAIVIHTDSGSDSVGDLYWQLEEPIWESGDAVTLQDEAGATQATFLVE
jgi:hypothetical protein